MRLSPRSIILNDSKLRRILGARIPIVTGYEASRRAPYDPSEQMCFGNHE